MALLEDGDNLTDEHGDVLCEGDVHHGARAVGVVADADLVDLVHFDGLDVQVFLLAVVRQVIQLVVAPLPLGLLVFQAEGDGVVHRGEEPLLPDEVLQACLAHRLVHAVAHHAEGGLDVAAPAVAHDVLQHVDGGGVDGHHGRHLQHDVLGLVDLLQVADVGQDHVLHVGRVREVHGGANAADEDVGDERAAALLLHVAVDRRARDTPQDGDLRPRGLVDDDDQRQGDRHGNTHEHAQEERADEGHNPEYEVLFLDFRQLDGLVVRNQRDDRVQHDGCQSKLRQVVEEWREEHQCCKHHDRRDEARKLREGTRGVAHGRPREAPGNRVAGEDRSHQVRDAQREHLLSSIYLIAVLCG
mmetsp:Transcript_85582/g.255054  ORF Transcript_85582/g.255054 Transcript_85582/m.255054 type:complete len:357 (+) Transcript_85582:400-1470(+)